MRAVRPLAVILATVVVLAAVGCAHYPDNPPLSHFDPDAGYRYKVVRNDPTPGRPFVLLSFSGGGTRAAAFSFGLMEELRNVEYAAKDGSRRRLLDDVEIISSVSGGSFTSAYYALFSDRFYADFPEKFLYRDIQKELFRKVLYPWNWPRLASPNFSRIDLAAELYDEILFGRKTFDDLVKSGRGNLPFLVLNSTDIGVTHRFEFTQDQFDLVCSDLSGVSVARAVAASSNFPVAFAPLTVNAYKEKCGPLPKWVELASEGKSYDRRYSDALAALSYREADNRFVHLLDGGISDNLGLRGPFQAITTTDSAWSILQNANLERLDRLMVIAANAKTTKKRSWNRKSEPPGVMSVLDVVTSGPMDDVSFDSVEMMADHFGYMKQLSATVDACNTLLRNCPETGKVSNPIPTDFTFAELSFDRIDDPRLRRCLQELPTSFRLPRGTVDLLRFSAARLLMTSDSFIVGMKRLDPTWTPPQGGDRSKAGGGGVREGIAVPTLTVNARRNENASVTNRRSLRSHRPRAGKARPGPVERHLPRCRG